MAITILITSGGTCHMRGEFTLSAAAKLLRGSEYYPVFRATVYTEEALHETATRFFETSRAREFAVAGYSATALGLGCAAAAGRAILAKISRETAEEREAAIAREIASIMGPEVVA